MELSLVGLIEKATDVVVLDAGAQQTAKMMTGTRVDPRLVRLDFRLWNKELQLLQSFRPPPADIAALAHCRC